jgi:hypothetical protein
MTGPKKPAPPRSNQGERNLLKYLRESLPDVYNDVDNKPVINTLEPGDIIYHAECPKCATPSCEVPPFPLSESVNAYQKAVQYVTAQGTIRDQLIWTEATDWAWAKAHEAKAGK